MLIKDSSIRTAIEQLDPTAGFELTKDNVLLNWNSSVRSQPTDEEIHRYTYGGRISLSQRRQHNTMAGGTNRWVI